MNRVPLLRFAGLPLVLLLSIASAWGAEAKRPNIIWIVGENFDLDFGCYGAENVETPNIDRLASNGVRYTNVFSTSPVCTALTAGIKMAERMPMMTITVRISTSVKPRALRDEWPRNTFMVQF